MSTNRHALIRYRVIDRCLRDRERTYHLSDLIEACSEALSEFSGTEMIVSRRAILYDLRFMKDDVNGFGAPIMSDRTDGYYYSIPDYSIFNIPIKKSDLDILKSALLDLKQISGHKGFKDLDSVITRLEETYNIKYSRNARPVVLFESSTNIDGQKHVATLKGYILDKQPLKITYQPFDMDETVRYIAPYLLKEYNNRWFLIGYEYDSEWEITILGLDRIRKIETSLREYHDHPEFDPSTWLRDLVGVTIYKDAVLTTVRFRVYGRDRHYVKTKPIHHSQQVLEFNGEYGEFTLEVIPNLELESKFLAYGASVEVLEPQWLREKMVERLEGALGRYV